MNEVLLSIISAGCGQLVECSLLMNRMVYTDKIVHTNLFNIIQRLECKMVTRLCRASFLLVEVFLVNMLLILEPHHILIVYFDQILQTYTFLKLAGKMTKKRKKKNNNKKIFVLSGFEPLCVRLLDYT